MASSCAVCGAPMMLSRVDARTCSPRCRKRLSRRAVFPSDMVAADRWVRWEKVLRNGRVTKRPLTVDGGAASSTDSSTWSSFRAVRSSRVGDGVGWVLGDGVGCVDLDHCLRDGVLDGWARAELERHDPLFVEVSQSGEGLHVFVAMPEGKGSVRRVPGGTVETYPPCSGRFIALTGNVFRG